MRHGSPDDYETFLRRETTNASNPDEKRRNYEIKTLRNLHPCVGQDMLSRMDGRLENADLPTDAKYPLILPARHALTRLIVFSEHAIIGSVKHYLLDCAKCSILKANSVRQLIAYLRECRITICIKSFKCCGLDYFDPSYFREGRSNRTAWGLLFTCLCTRCLHEEVVTSIDLDSFLLAFSRFTNLRGAVDPFYSD